MKKHHVASIIVSGAVVGVMIGVSTFVSETPGFSAALASPSLVRQILQRRNRPTPVTTTRIRTLADAADSNQPTPTKCDGANGMATEAIAKARDLWDGSKLSAFEDFIAVTAQKYCNDPQTAVHNAGNEAQPLDNHCEKYAGPRYTECIGQERAGNRYPLE